MIKKYSNLKVKYDEKCGCIRHFSVKNVEQIITFVYNKL